MKETLDRKSLNIEEAKVSVEDTSEWCSICRGFDELFYSFQDDIMKRLGGWLWKSVVLRIHPRINTNI